MRIAPPVAAKGALLCACLSVGAVAFVTAATFTFALYPTIGPAHHAGLDPDGYGTLGRCLSRFGTLCYSDGQPTVSRGPLYPLFIAALLRMTAGWWPYAVQGGQCLLHGMTCVIVFLVARRLWNVEVGIISSMLCAIHPLLVWYTSRIWIETLATFLLTAVVAATACVYLAPTLVRSYLLGVLIGLGCLCKATFLPFILVVPIALRLARGRAVGASLMLCIALGATLVVLPWSVRNWWLTGRVIPVHVLMGYNMWLGDEFVDRLSHSPFGSAALSSAAHQEAPFAGLGSPGDDAPLAQREATFDAALLRRSVARYARDPAFVAKKVVVNAWLFWVMSETPLKTLSWMVLQIPLLALFMWAALRALWRPEGAGIQGVHIAMLSLYVAEHLPLYAVGRLSVVLVPTMVMYAVATVYEVWRSAVFRAASPDSATAVDEGLCFGRSGG